MKLIWKVDPEPTGPYKSFLSRGWPSAELGGELVLQIFCPEKDDYTPAKARGDRTHKPLRVRVTDRRQPVGAPILWQWRTIKGEFATLAEAKEAGKKFLCEHPEILGEQKKIDQS
jgi:hypothetical protein